MRLVLLVLCAVLVSACATGAGVTGMSAEQIKEFAKLKDSTVTCVRGVYAGVTVTATYLNVDSVKNSPTGLLVDDNCKITFSNIRQSTP